MSLTSVDLPLPDLPTIAVTLPGRALQRPVARIDLVRRVHHREQPLRRRDATLQHALHVGQLLERWNDRQHRQHDLDEAARGKAAFHRFVAGEEQQQRKPATNRRGELDPQSVVREHQVQDGDLDHVVRQRHSTSPPARRHGCTGGRPRERQTGCGVCRTTMGASPGRLTRIGSIRQ